MIFGTLLALGANTRGCVEPFGEMDRFVSNELRLGNLGRRLKVGLLAICHSIVHGTVCERRLGPKVDSFSVDLVLFLD